MGQTKRYKERLGIKGFTQTAGIDYDSKGRLYPSSTFFGNKLRWPFQQLDVKNAIFHGDLEEEAYMEFPSGPQFSSAKGKVCN
jgi:hypothetical protein